MRFRKFFSILLALAVLLAMTPAFDVPALAASMPYYIKVDLTNQIVTIYDTQTKDIVRQCLCSSGAKDATPTGTFTMPEKERDSERKPWFHFNAFGGYARYASRIYIDVMFHSLLYNRPNVNSLNMQSVKDYGKPVSHGCIRMRWQDAEFIAKNCLKGTKVTIYKSGERDDDLRELLYQASYTNENGQTYLQYLGAPVDDPDALGKGSEGSDVKNLQLRLRDLGIFTETISGSYDLSTVKAVRDTQKLLGMNQTGVATKEFQEAIKSSEAPSAMNVTLKEGGSGVAVRNFQQNLATLGLYDGAIDGVYDVDVIEAVKVFQSAYGCDIDGIATPFVQKAVYYEAGRVKAMFSVDDNYNFEKVDEQIYMGRVNCELGIRLREKTSKDSHSLGVLKHGNVVVALERGNDWSKVQKGKLSGYVMNQYIDFYPQVISSLRYSSDTSSTVYTIGYTAENYYTGADRPADKFQEYLESGGSLDSYEGMVNYATVRTEGDQKLRLREAPNTGSGVLDEISNGTSLKVKLSSDDWTMVDYNGASGYLLNQYLDFWTGPENALGTLEGGASPARTEETDAEDDEAYDLEDDDVGGIEHAVVACDTADKASVYEEDFEDATVLGSLKNGVKVDVLQTIDGWSHISFEGHEGYMREMDLKFVVEGLTT